MNIPTNTHSTIQLKGIELSLHFGWHDTERLKPQNILVDIELRFPQTPQACLSDNLADTYCYDALIRAITIATTDQHFKLVEHLAFQIYQTIKKTVSSDTQTRIIVMKKPPIANLTGGVTFTFGDNFT